MSKVKKYAPNKENCVDYASAIILILISVETTLSGITWCKFTVFFLVINVNEYGKIIVYNTIRSHTVSYKKIGCFTLAH
jgi:hypothetical protein